MAETRSCIFPFWRPDCFLPLRRPPEAVGLVSQVDTPPPRELAVPWDLAQLLAHLPMQIRDRSLQLDSDTQQPPGQRRKPTYKVLVGHGTRCAPRPQRARDARSRALQWDSGKEEMSRHQTVCVLYVSSDRWLVPQTLKC